MPPNQNSTNSYFVMTDINNIGSTKRFLQQEERNVLCDLGYSVNSTYGNNFTSLNSFKNYSTSFTGIIVAGVNDGINSTDSSFTFNVEASSTISTPINGFGTPNFSFLNNDKNATGFECLQDLSSSSTIFNFTSGTSSTGVTFKSTVVGIHLLRYVPTYGAQKGNITYIFIKVKKPLCAVVLPNEVCNLVPNGEFEQNTSIPQGVYSQSNLICNWFAPNTATPDYYHTNTPTPSFQIPCLLGGFQDINPLYGGNAFIGLLSHLNIYMEPEPKIPYRECVGIKLKQKLVANVTYKLSFDISLAEAYSRNAYKIQAFLSDKEINITNSGNIPILNSSMLFQDNSFGVETSNWRRVTITFISTTGTEEYLYLGFLKDTQSTAIVPSTNQTCSTVNFIAPYLEFLTNKPSYYYLDNVELLQMTAPLISGSNAACLSANAITTNTTTLAIGQTAAWTIIGGVGTITGANITSATIFWTTLPGIIKLTITDTATGCSSISTKTIANVCPCDCINNLITTFYSQLDDMLIYEVMLNAASICTNLNLRYTWTFPNGTTAITTSKSIVSLMPSVMVKIELLSNSGAVLCTAYTGYFGNATPQYGQTSLTNNSSDITFKNNFDTFSNEKLKVSPNPSSGIFTLQNSGITDKVTIIVTDINGRIIYKLKDKVLERENNIDLTKFQSGVYLMKIIGENIDFAEKLIKN